MGTTDLLGLETPERLPTCIPICSRPLPKFNWQPQKEAVPLFSWSGRLGWETASTSGYGEKKGTAWEEGWEENKRRELEWRRCLVWIKRAVQRGGWREGEVAGNDVTKHWPWVPIVEWNYKNATVIFINSHWQHQNPILIGNIKT